MIIMTRSDAFFIKQRNFDKYIHSFLNIWKNIIFRVRKKKYKSRIQYIETDLLRRTSVVLILTSRQKMVLSQYCAGKFLMGYAKIDISD